MKLEFSKFSTDGLFGDEKYESYKENIGGIFDVELPKSAIDGLNACIDSYFLDGLILVKCSTIAQLFFRDEHKIANDGLDHFIVQIFLQGGTAGVGKFEKSFCDQGSIFFIDCSRPWRAFNPDFLTLTLVVPRALLRRRVGGLNFLHGHSLEVPGNPYAKLFRDFVIGIYQDSAFIEKEYSQALSQNCIDLLACALKHSDPARFKSDSQFNLMGQQVKEYIENNLSNPDLSVSSLTKKFLISRSSLYRLFPQEGEGINQFIKTKRMHKAYRDIYFIHESKSISEVAYDCGFKNVSSFSRAFREHFGMTPKELMNGVLGDEQSVKENRVRWHRWIELIG